MKRWVDEDGESYTRIPLGPVLVLLEDEQTYGIAVAALARTPTPVVTYTNKEDTMTDEYGTLLQEARDEFLREVEDLGTSYIPDWLIDAALDLELTAEQAARIWNAVPRCSHNVPT